MSEQLLEIKRVTKTYLSRNRANSVLALDNVDLSVAKGEFVSLYGPSGCGKSTLLLAAGTLLKPDRGKVLINGQDPYLLNSTARAGLRALHIGFVFQRFHLIPYLTVLENVLVPELATDRTFRDKALEVLDRFGLNSRLDHYPSELSVGEQQRAAMSRAVYRGISIILADEPTGNLDNENGKIILKFIRDFVDDGGAALMVTHENFACEYATRKIEMKDGKLLTPF